MVSDSLWSHSDSETLEVSLLSKRVGRLQERVTALSEASAGKNSLTGTQIWCNACLFFHKQSFQGVVGCAFCLCSAENLEPSHVPETAEKQSGIQGTLEMRLIMSINSFLSAAQMAEKQIFFTDINKIFQF